MSHRFQSQSAVLCCCLMLGFAGCGGDEATEVAQNPAPATPAPASSSSSDDKNSGEEGGYAGGESYGGESYGGESYGGESSGDSGESGGYDGGYSGGYDGAEDEDEGMGGYDGGYDGGYGGEGEDEGMGGYDGGYGGGRPSVASAGGGRPSVASAGGGYDGGDEGMGYDGGYGDEGMGYDGGYGDEGMGYGGPGVSGPGMGQSGMGASMDGPGMGAPGMGGPGMGQARPGMAFANVNQFLVQNCSTCHMRGQTKGEVSLAEVTPHVGDNADLWESVASVLEEGSMPPRGRRQPPAQQKQAVIDWIRTELADAEEAMKDLLATAKRKFGSGNQEQGIEFLYAHLVSSDPEAVKEQLSEVGFYMRGRKPVTALRFAAAVVVDVPDSMKDVKPIGSSQFSGAGGGGYGGGGYGDGFGGRRNGQSETKRTFESLTGELGGRVVSEFESRWADGKFGTLFADATLAEPESDALAAAAGGYGGGMYGGGGGMGGGMYDGGDEGYGGAGPGMGMGGPGMGGGGGETRAESNTLPGQSLAVGLTYLGDGDRKEILEKFSESGADVLFLFDMDVKTNNRTRIVTNKTTVRIVDAAGETVGASRQMINTDVEKARFREKDDGLDANIERLYGLLDREVSVIPMPNSMAAKHAQARMATILSDQSVTPLRKMFEARLYNSMGLLTAEELSMVYQIVLDGNEGVSLATGSNEDRQFVIQSKLETLMAL